MKCLGDNVRWRRQVLGMSQAELASKVRMDHRHRANQPYISRLENGLVDPRLSCIRSLSRALGVKVSHLLTNMTEHTAFWDSYLALSPAQKREVQRHIDWLRRGHA